MSGQNDFKMKITMVDVVSITNRAADSTIAIAKEAMDAGATLEDLRTVEVLHALKSFMEERHVDPGFELELRN